MSARRTRRAAHRPWLIAGVLLVAIGVGLLGYSALNYYFYDRSIQPAVAAQPTPTPGPTNPVRVIIPGVLDEPLQPGSYADGKWSVSETTGTYLVQSAKPGEPGNVIIYGHNKGEIFGPLVKVRTDQPITLKLEDGRERHYKVKSTVEVGQDQTDVLAPTDTEVLTLYTCTGWLDRNRFIVKAVPVE